MGKILRYALNEDDDFYFSCKEKHIGFKLSPRVKFFEILQKTVSSPNR
jgi:hypothetical protein